MGGRQTGGVRLPWALVLRGRDGRVLRRTPRRVHRCQCDWEPGHCVCGAMDVPVDDEGGRMAAVERAGGVRGVEGAGEEARDEVVCYEETVVKKRRGDSTRSSCIVATRSTRSGGAAGGYVRVT